MIIDEKTPFQKIVTEWIFQQSAAVVMSFVTHFICLIFIFFLWTEVKRLHQNQMDMLIYQRNSLETTVKENTRALENFKIYQDGRLSIKKM